MGGSFSNFNRHFTYVTTHSPTLPSLYLRHSSFSNPSVASPTSSSFSNPSFASPTSQDFHLCQLASRPWNLRGCLHQKQIHFLFPRHLRCHSKARHLCCHPKHLKCSTFLMISMLFQAAETQCAKYVWFSTLRLIVHGATGWRLNRMAIRVSYSVLVHGATPKLM